MTGAATRLLLTRTSNRFQALVTAGAIFQDSRAEPTLPTLTP